MEQRWRWRRENRAAARLLYYEVISNRAWLTGILEHPGSEGLSTMLSHAVWDSEQVRVASQLPSRQLNRVAATYFGISNLLSTRPLVGDEKWRESLSGDGKAAVTQTLENLAGSEVILTAAMLRRSWPMRVAQNIRERARKTWRAMLKRLPRSTQS